MRDRSDLELVVLGIVWKMGPLTPYAIRKEFLTSPTPHFSGSAGAIYPLVRRLEDDGLLRSSPTRTGRRRSRQYRTTASGTAALKSWFRPPLPDEDAGAPFDPIRTRIYFLQAMPRSQRRVFLDDALAAMQRQLPIVRADEQRYLEAGDTFSRLASRGIRQSLESRIAWLQSVRRTLIAGDLA